jgi:FlaG/FlaF family flagellin (archaellin)
MLLNFKYIYRLSGSSSRISFLKQEQNRDDAVSPVVGIMLMLTITLILAAIISGMTGGIAQTQKKPPSLLMDVSMVNSSGYNSMDLAIVSVNEAIPTRDLKFITEWRNSSTLIRNTITMSSPLTGTRRYPVGLSTNSSGLRMDDFGNFSLMGGTRLFANTSESLTALFTEIPPAGSNVRIQFVHIPSGAIIADKELTVEEG